MEQISLHSLMKQIKAHFRPNNLSRALVLPQNEVAEHKLSWKKNLVQIYFLSDAYLLEIKKAQSTFHLGG